MGVVSLVIVVFPLKSLDRKFGIFPAPFSTSLVAPVGLWKTENRMEVLKGSKKEAEANLGVPVPNLTHTFPVWEVSVRIADWAWNFRVSQDGEPRLVS